MTKPLHVTLNIDPYILTASQRQQILAACTGRSTELRILNASADIDSIDSAGAEVLVTEDIPHNLSNWTELRFVQLLSAGIDHLNEHPIWERPATVATAAGTHAVSIAQYVTCSLLMLVHHMPRAAVFKSTRQWPDRMSMASTTLRGKTVGLIGYGGIGRECARQLRALGMRIVCLKHRANQQQHEGFISFEGIGDPAGALPEKWFGPSQLCEMLPLCDVLIVTAPRTDESMGMIGSTELATLPVNARVVIVSRGGIVDELALAEALKSEQIAGAVVDAYLHEPPASDNPLFDAPNLVMTPHISGVFGDYWDVACELLCQNLGRYIRGEPVLNRADGRRGY